MSKVAQLIRFKIKEKGISTHALEKLAGLKPSSIHNILQGKSKNPTLHTLQAISLALECPLDELVDQKPLVKASSQPWHAALFTQATELANTIFTEKKLTPTKKQAMNYIEEIYNYALLSKTMKADKTFAEWLITKQWF